MVRFKKCSSTFANKSNLNRHDEIVHLHDSDERMNSDYDDDDDETISIVSETEEESYDSIDDNEEEENKDDGEQDEDDGDNEDEESSLWMDMKNEALDLKVSLLDLYKEKIMFHRNLKRTSIHRAVMQTLQRARDEEDMSFSEALDYAVDKRKFLILKSTAAEEKEEEEETVL